MKFLERLCGALCSMHRSTLLCPAVLIGILQHAIEQLAKQRTVRAAPDAGEHGQFDGGETDHGRDSMGE